MNYKLRVFCFALPFASLVLFFLLPYMAAFSLAFTGGGAGAASAFYIPPSIKSVFLWTMEQALLSAFFSLALALPAAYILSKYNNSQSAAFRVISAVPFTLPGLLMALGFIIFWGNSGYVNKALAALSGGRLHVFMLYKKSAVVMAHICFNFPVVLQFAYSAFSTIRLRYEGAAAVLGARPAQNFFFITLPLAAPSLAASVLLVFLYCWTSFAVALILSGGPAGTTLAVEIYRYARVSLNPRMAGVLALLESTVSFFVFALYLYFQKKNKLDFLNDNSARKEIVQRRAVFAAFGQKTALCLMFVLITAPVFSIIADSFFAMRSRAGISVFTLNNYIRNMPLIALCTLRSLLLALFAAAIALILAVCTSEVCRGRGRGGTALLRFLVMLPAASSGIVLALGFAVLYGTQRSRSLFALVMLHALLALPFAFNLLDVSLNSLPPNLLAAAETLGATPLVRILKIDLPLIKDKLKSAFAFSACVSAGELNCPLMLGIKDYETLPLYIYRAASSYRYGAAGAAGTVLVLLIIVLLTIQLNRQKSASFLPQ